MGRLPLEGIRIIDVTMVWAGPFATKLLADAGAEVIKVEAPGNVDLTRNLGIDAFMFRPPSAADRPYNRSAYFNEYNRNKLSVALNLSHTKGRELFLRLVRTADVVMENYRPDVMDKLDLSYETLREIKPDIIMVSMPGYAKRGREAGLVGYGPNIEQMAGLATLNGYAGGPPQKTGISYGDPVAGAAAAAAAIAALIYKRRTGKGQYVEISQRNTLIGVIGEAIMEWGMNRRLLSRTGNRHPWMAPHGCYPCRPLPAEEGRPLATMMSAGRQKATDRWVTIAVDTDEQWSALCEAMGREELIEDERFADGFSRWRHQDELDEVISAWTSAHADYDIFHLLQSKGVPAGPVLTPLALARDPHLNERGFFETVEHPEMGANTVTRPTWQLEQTPVHVRRPAPCFAEHNHHVLHDVLGLSESEIDRLEEEGVTGRAPVSGGSPV